MNFKDRFLEFTYNGVHSSEFNAFYENNGEDISFPFSQVVSHETSSPMFQDKSYWLGSSRDSKTFDMNIAIADKTFEQTEEIFEWLDPSKPGTLIVDYRPNYTYRVLITSIDPPTIIPRQYPNGLVKNLLMFSITFTTIGSHLAETTEAYLVNKGNATKPLLEPDYLYPIMVNTRSKLNFINWSKERQYLDFSVSGRSLAITKEDRDNGNEVWYQYSLPKSATMIIDSEIGAATTGNKLIEFLYPKEKLSLNKGPMPIEPGTLFTGEIEVDRTGVKAKVIPNSRFGSLGESDTFVMVIVQEVDENTPMVDLSTDRGDPVNGVYPGQMVDGKPKLYMPEYLIGKRNLGALEFDIPGASGLQPGKHKVKVKIASTTKVAVTVGNQPDDEYRISFKYRKGV